MNPQLAQLTGYIKQNLAQGVSQQAIYKTLVNSGWPVELVNSAFAGLQLPAAASTPQPVQQPQPQPAAQPLTPQDPESVVIHPQGWRPPVQPAVGTPIVGSQTTPPVSSNIAAPAAATDAPQKYRLFRAIVEAVQAIKHNAVAITLSIVIGYGLFTPLLIFLPLLTVGIVFSSNESASANVVLSKLAVAVILYAVVTTIVDTLLLVLMSLGVRDGHEGRKSNLGELFKTGVKKLLHVGLASLLYGIVLGLPTLLCLFGLFASLLSGSSNNTTSLLFGAGIIVSLAWILVAFLRYALVPFVAIFEPELSAWQTLGRSKYLLHHGGQWFLFKGILLYGVVLVPLSAITNHSSDNLLLSHTLSIPLIVIYTLISIVGNSVQVLLYLNRKAVKG